MGKSKRNRDLATIRIERPRGKFGAWVIATMRGDFVFQLAERDLATAIMLWRLARKAGKFDRLPSTSKEDRRQMNLRDEKHTPMLNAYRGYLVQCAKVCAIATPGYMPQSIEITVHPDVFHALAAEAASTGIPDYFPHGETRAILISESCGVVTIRQGAGR